MKTQEKKLQHVMEAAGYKYEPFHGHLGYYHGKAWQCEGAKPLRGLDPDDLNKLFWLSDKLGYTTKRFKIEIMTRIECFIGKSITEANYGYGCSDTEALLNALFIATGGKE